MPINVDALMNWPYKDIIQAYDVDDTIFYALSIGLGQENLDQRQLRYVYERDIKAFPTMAVVLGAPRTFVADPTSGIDYSMAVHGEQAVKIHKPLSASGVIRARDTITGVFDKGKDRGAIVVSERRISDDGTGALLATLRSGIVCRAEGGFGGPPVPKRESANSLMESAPDMAVEMPISRQAALMYRLNADRNPLHADPEVARKAGFSEPVLHGLCTWGIAAHAIVKACCDYDGDRLAEFGARFSKPVFPGETMSVEIWQSGREIRFRAWVHARNAKVLDSGCARIA